MPTPQEICLEDLDRTAPHEQEERYVRCVALAGGEPGLALDRAGTIRWMTDDAACHGLWVSADERLMLLRGAAAGPIVVSRGGRTLEAPAEKPVVLLDQDLLLVDGRRLRVHVHGEAEAIYPPEPLRGSALARVVRAAAAALALGAAVGAGSAAEARPGQTPGAAPPIEVRARPPVARQVRMVTCTVQAVAPAKQGPLKVYATCPAGSGVAVGNRGYLIDAKGAVITKGSVVVKKVDGTKVVGETTLPRPIKASKVRIYLND